MNDAMQLTVPLTSAVVACLGLLSSIVAVVLWAFSTFERKDVVAKLASDVAQVEADSHKRHDGTAEKMDAMRETVNRTANDVAFIRGRMESSNAP